MRMSVREILRTRGLELCDTIFDGENDSLLDFVLTLGDFFEVKDGSSNAGDAHHRICEFNDALQYETARLTDELKNGLSELARLTDEVKKSRDDTKNDRLRELAEQRHTLRSAITELEKQSRAKLVSERGFEPANIKLLEYKSRVVLTTFESIRQIIPELDVTELEIMRAVPWLTTSLAALRNAYRSNEPLGFVGGPCLFGMDEVLLEIETSAGIDQFDCSCGRRSVKDSSENEDELTLDEYFAAEHEKINEIRIVNRKAGITYQEYISLLLVFEAAERLGGKVVIPLPDMSYMKQMAAAAEPLPAELRERLLADYEHEVFAISNKFLRLIEVMQRQYPELPVAVLHARDAEICEMFYSKRASYIEKQSFTRKTMQMGWRAEAVIDYITMLALPFYIFGTRDVVQVDSLDETDSGRKCQKLHGGDITMHSLLFPELISFDGINTIYNAGIEHKEYISEALYDRRRISR